MVLEPEGIMPAREEQRNELVEPPRTTRNAPEATPLGLTVFVGS